MLIASEGTLFAALHRHVLLPALRNAALAARRDRHGRAVAAPGAARRCCWSPRACRCMLASRAARAGRLGRACAAARLRLVVQAAPTSPTRLHDLRDQLATLAFSRDAYSSINYMLLGADHAHVAVGILLSVWLLAKLAARPDGVPGAGGDRPSPGTGTSSTLATVVVTAHAALGRRMTSAASAHAAVGRARGSAPRPGSSQLVAGLRRSPRPSAAPAAAAGASATTPGRGRSWRRATSSSCAEAAAVTVLLRTRGASYEATAPLGRIRFFAIAAVLANLLFLMIVLLSGIASIAERGMPPGMSAPPPSCCSCSRARPRRALAAGRRGRRGSTCTASYCVACHGPTGRAWPRRAGARRRAAARRRTCSRPRALAPRRRRARGRLLPPHRLHAAAATRARSPAARRVDFSEPQIRRARRVRRLARHRARRSRRRIPSAATCRAGMQLFTDHCAGCHQIAAAGGYVTGARAAVARRGDRRADRRGGAHRART